MEADRHLNSRVYLRRPASTRSLGSRSPGNLCGVVVERGPIDLDRSRCFPGLGSPPNHLILQCVGEVSRQLIPPWLSFMHRPPADRSYVLEDILDFRDGFEDATHESAPLATGRLATAASMDRDERVLALSGSQAVQQDITGITAQLALGVRALVLRSRNPAIKQPAHDLT